MPFMLLTCKSGPPMEKGRICFNEPYIEGYGKQLVSKPLVSNSLV